MQLVFTERIARRQGIDVLPTAHDWLTELDAAPSMLTIPAGAPPHPVPSILNQPCDVSVLQRHSNATQLSCVRLASNLALRLKPMVTRRAVQATCLAVTLMLSRVPSIEAAEHAPDYANIDRYVQSQVDANHFPGVALAVVERASLAHAQGFGHDSQGQQVTAQTP